MNLSNNVEQREVRHKKIHKVLFDLYEVQKATTKSYCGIDGKQKVCLEMVTVKSGDNDYF